MDSLNLALERMSHQTPMDFQEGMETLLVYIRNLLEFPEEKKYRKVKISNIHFQERLGRLDGSKEAMGAIGFHPDGDFYIFDTDKEKLDQEELVSELKSFEQLIVSRLEESRKAFDSAAHEHQPQLTHKYSSIKGAACFGDIGKRQTMEDAEIIIDQFLGEPATGFFAVYDGHGGRTTVDFVVKAMHLNLEHYLKTHPNASVDEAFKPAFLSTDGQGRRMNILQSGSTAVVCVIRVDPKTNKRMLYVANVGDSRAILSHSGEAQRLTIDHKPTNPDEEKRVLDAGGIIGRHKRVNNVLAISRAIGDHMLKPNDVVTAIPHVEVVELTDKEDYLLLACDGVWDVMQDQDAIDFVQKKMKAFEQEHKEYTQEQLNKALEDASRELVFTAIDKKSMDNVTVMIVKL